MMTLLVILAIVGVITAIARYNEDDRLFWQLFISFVGAIAAGIVVKNMISEKKQDKVIMINESPTQVLESTPCLLNILADVSLSATKREKSPKPVSKDYALNQKNSILSEVCATVRGPTPDMYFDDS